jgi:hypothetical protein
VREATDLQLNRIDIVDFAAAHGLPEGRVLDAFAEEFTVYEIP